MKTRFLRNQEAITLRAYKNIALSFTFKGLGIAANLLIVPLTLGYLTNTNYGIWLTISGLLHWITFFDFGLSNGLRIKFAEALLRKDNGLARILTSTAYFTVGAIGAVLILIFFSLYFFFAPEILSEFEEFYSPYLAELILFVLIAFTVRLTAGLIYAMLAADQKVGLIGFFELITNLLSLVAIYLIKLFSHDSLFLAGASFSFIIAIVPVLANIYFFSGSYKPFLPLLSCINFKYAKELLKLGGTFFFLQAAILILFFSNNFIITAILGPEQVTVYNIPAKYLNTITMLSIIIFNPYWAAASEAFQLNNFIWLKKAKKQLILTWIGLTFLTTLMVIFSPYVYELWINDIVNIPFTVTALIGVYTSLLLWTNTFGYLLNGMGKIKLQLIVYSVAAIFIVPLSYIFASKLNWGLQGIAIANIISILPASILIPIQFKYLVQQKKSTSKLIYLLFHK